MQSVTFDLDGTLIDSVADLAVAVNHVREKHGLPSLPPVQICSYVGEGPRLLLERAFADQPGADIDCILPEYKEYYQKHMMNLTVLYPGVKEGLAELHSAGFALAVLTNKHQEATHALLERFGIASYFTVVIGSGMGFPNKPEPDALLHILKELGADKSKSWMVGDHFTDLETGRRAGVKRAYATWGFGNPRSESWDYRAQTFPELVKAISSI